MKKSNKSKAQSRISKVKSQKQKTENIDENRRSILGKLTYLTIGIVGVGGLSTYFYQDYQANAAERDLSRIGQGFPTIVQVHDPNCSLCNELQRNTKSAISQLDSDQLQYLVADIRTTSGQAFANMHRVPHVTLLLFDANGGLKNVVRGVRKKSELLAIFSRLARSG
ncbi:MAG: hypothetical protein AAF217_14950 [Pseudomonadota bacterium]